MPLAWSSPTFLAAASTTATPVGSMLTWSAVLLVLLVLAFLAYAQLKRWMAAPEETSGEGFTFSDLRELHRQGKLSDAEYESARAMLVSSTQKAAGPLPDPMAGRSRPAAAERRGATKRG